MENKILTILREHKELIISDLDSEGGIEISVNDRFEEVSYFYLNLDEITKLRNHLRYVTTKADQL